MQHRDDLARLITRENGKTFKEAQGEVDYGCAFIEFYADDATRALGEMIPAPVPGRRLLAEREPVGVCAAITPWNFPLAMLTRKVGPALAAGCTMVAKPASATPLTALAFARLGEEAGVPKGVFSVLTGSAREIGGVLTASPVVRKLSFTGSTEIGVQLYRDCAGTMKKLGLELGGNAPLLIFDDADLGTAVETAMIAKFRNGGQSCIAANRIYVQDGIRDRFLAAFGEKVGKMHAGDGFDPANDIGPLIDDAGVDKVEEHRDEALQRGARAARRRQRARPRVRADAARRRPAGRAAHAGGDLRPARRGDRLRHASRKRSASPTPPRSASPPTCAARTRRRSPASRARSKAAWSGSTPG